MPFREAAGIAATAAGLAATVPSVRHTFGHVTDESYRAPEARHGAGHVQYHMAREVLITSGALGAIVTGALSGPGRGRALWRAMACCTAGYTAAMWSGGPLNGKWAPNPAAVRIHAASTAGLVTGLVLLRPRR